MNRRLLTFPIVLVALLLSWGSVPAGQQRPPSVSSDLEKHAQGLHTHRVIVQTSDSGLDVLRRGGAGLLRRELKGAAVLEVNDAQLEALRRNPRYSHLSVDL